MKTNLVIIAIAATFTLMLSFNTHTYSWHENLGIDAKKAAELYQTKPNDPAIFQWKNALQSAITDMDKDKCFDIDEAINCQSLISTIISNCNSHPNTLLACNDVRLAQYPSILAKAEEELIKLREAQNIFEKCMEEGGTYDTCMNSTVSPSSNVTGNSSASNSTYP